MIDSASDDILRDHLVEPEARRPREVRRGAAMHAHEQRAAEMPFQYLDVVGHGRRCDVEFLGRLGEALAAGSGFEEAAGSQAGEETAWLRNSEQD